MTGGCAPLSLVQAPPALPRRALGTAWVRDDLHSFDRMEHLPSFVADARKAGSYALQLLGWEVKKATTGRRAECVKANPAETHAARLLRQLSWSTSYCK